MMKRHLLTCATIVLIFAGSPLDAQPVAQDASPKMQASAKACPKASGTDALLVLSRACAKDLLLDSNCRAHEKEGTEDYVVIKDCSPNKPEGYLVIPVRTVTGLEDSRVFSAGVVNLWDDGWRWAREHLDYPAARLALAVNSRSARSQNQLHLHVSCILPSVKRAVEHADIPFYPGKATPLELGARRHLYQIVRVRNLHGKDGPFNVAAAMTGAGGSLKDQSIAVMGSTQTNEYYVLSTKVAGLNRGHAEELLDQTCARLAEAP